MDEQQSDHLVSRRKQLVSSNELAAVALQLDQNRFIGPSAADGFRSK
jgi:hypothetical protein